MSDDKETDKEAGIKPTACHCCNRTRANSQREDSQNHGIIYVMYCTVCNGYGGSHLSRKDSP